MPETPNIKIVNYSAEFPIKLYHSASRNSVQNPGSVQKSAKIIFKSVKPTQKLNWSKKAKKVKINLAIFKNEKKPKELKKDKNYKFGLKKAKLATLRCSLDMKERSCGK